MLYNEEDYKRSVSSLRLAAKKIPRSWGKVQNNKYDALSNSVIFGGADYNDVMEKMRGRSEEEINYTVRRWFIHKCSECDEYIFRKQDGVKGNPNIKDNEWDFSIGGTRFDLKGTRLPSAFNIGNLMDDPFSVIKWYYDNQSKERRFGLQNRLFLIHESLAGKERGDFMRCAFGTKENAVSDFVGKFNDVKIFDIHGAKSTLLLVYENAGKETEWWYPRKDTF